MAAPNPLQAFQRRCFFTQDELSTYSVDQMDLFLYIRDGHTWKDAEIRFNITGPQVISTIIMNTATGYPWTRGTRGGRKTIISPVDSIELLKQLHERADEADCVPTYEALTIAQSLIEFRRIRAEYLLHAVHSDRLIDRLDDDKEVTIMQLKFLIERNGMTLANKQDLAELRRKFCTYYELDSWYDFIGPFLQDLPYLTFNADETVVASHSDGKVVTIKKRLPLVSGIRYNSHITAMCCYSASGEKVPLFVILQNLQKVPEELKMIPNVYFASSASGWITNVLFTAWVIHFCTWLSKYRADYLAEHYPQNKDKPVILFLDGHGSRINYDALYLLRAHNVIAITFRSHTTHLCQPFDVVIASPLKVYLRQFWLSAEKRYAHLLPSALAGTKRLRFLLIFSLIDAVDAAMSKANCATSFAATGLLPYDKSKVLTNANFVHMGPPPPPPPQPQIWNQPGQFPARQRAPQAGMQVQALRFENQPIRINGRIHIGEKILTSDKVLQDLYQAINGFNNPGGLANVDFVLQKTKVFSSNLAHGKMLSHFGMYYVRLPMGGLIQIP